MRTRDGATTRRTFRPSTSFRIAKDLSFQNSCVILLVLTREGNVDEGRPRRAFASDRILTQRKRPWRCDDDVIATTVPNRVIKSGGEMTRGREKRERKKKKKIRRHCIANVGSVDEQEKEGK